MAKARHYILPFLIFLLLTEASRYFLSYFFVVYALKTLLVGGLLWCWRKKFQELYVRPDWKELFVAVGAGFLVFIFWIAGENFFPQLGKPDGYSPYQQAFSTTLVCLTILFRLIGAAVVVPIMEELFWRSFLMRYLIDRKFLKIPLGTYTHLSFWAVVFLFALEHFRIIPGALAGITYGGLLCVTRKIWVPIMAHALTNLSLGIYVLATGQWKFW